MSRRESTGAGPGAATVGCRTPGPGPPDQRQRHPVAEQDLRTLARDAGAVQSWADGRHPLLPFDQERPVASGGRTAAGRLQPYAARFSARRVSASNRRRWWRLRAGAGSEAEGVGGGSGSRVHAARSIAHLASCCPRSSPLEAVNRR